MASLLAHAALPLVVLGAARPALGPERRVAIAAVVCSCLPDLDMIGVLFEVRPTDPTGHRGVAHSLVMAALVALFVAIVWFRSLGLWGPRWRRLAWFLFAVTASHGVVDAMTTGEAGVALLSPFDRGRHFLPLALLPSCPVGLTEWLGFWGLLTIANEVFYLLVPVGIVASLFRSDEDERRRLFRAGAIWGVAAIALRLALPDWFAPTVPRAMRALGDDGDPNEIPHHDLRRGELVRRFDELSALGLFGTTLRPANATWSSSFFPSWFGGEAGRWSEGNPTLVARTLFGFAPPSERDARDWLARASSGDEAARRRIFTLAPTEKVDLVFGRFGFPATVEALALSHNGHPRFWSGRCNGIAGASMKQPEPFRVVDVIGVDGSHVAFHPNDVKALLAVAYYDPVTELTIGKTCDTVSFDSGATCSMNPGLFVLALANRIGLAKQSFLVDAVPTIAKQYYAVAGARIDVLGRDASSADVAIELELSSTTLRYAAADVKDEGDPSGTRYRKVGVVPVVMRHRARLALDPDSRITGGMWTGEPADGPDAILVVDGGPKVDARGMLAAAKNIHWPFVRELARASADGASAAPTLDLRTACDGACR